MKIVWSFRARQHLRSIYAFIAEDSETQAQAQIGRIMERAEWLAANPVKSHPIHEFPTSGWLDAHVGNYRIIHKIAGDELRIGLVLHRKQLLKRALLR